jgi:hypothetical protein
MAETVTPTDEALLDEVQRAAFDYFLQTVNPANGLVADTSRENSPVSIAVVGFALSSYPVAVERGRHITADSSRLRNELGWRPQVDLVAGMAELAALSRSDDAHSS